MKKFLAAVSVAMLMATNAIASTIATVNLDGVTVDGGTTTTLTQTAGVGTVTDIAFDIQVLHLSPSWGSETQVSIQAPDGSKFSFGGNSSSSFGFGSGSGIFSFVGSFAVAATSAAGNWVFSFNDSFPDAVNPNYVFLRPSSISLNGVSPVPLPAAGFLLMGALGGLGLMRRRRKAA